MSLYLTNSKVNPLAYKLWDGTSPLIHYNEYLVTLPRLYMEELLSICGFYYSGPPDDCFYLWTLHNQYYWPSWSVNRYKFDAATGNLLERFDAQSIFSVVYIDSVQLADLNHCYATWRNTMMVGQVDNTSLADQGSQWSFNSWNWTPQRHFDRYVVNRVTDTVLGSSGFVLEIWTDVRGTPRQIYGQKLPTTVSNIAYESNEYAWVLLSTGQILKVNWGTNPRVEMFSSIQSPDPTDRQRLLAYDSLRRRLAIYRWKPNASDGSAQSQIDFYQTIAKPFALTAPVPVNTCRAGGITQFVANVTGSMGEGFVGQQGVVSLVSPKNHGVILSPNPVSMMNGSMLISYQAPSSPYDEEIQLDITFSDTIT